MCPLLRCVFCSVLQALNFKVCLREKQEVFFCPSYCQTVYHIHLYTKSKKVIFKSRKRLRLLFYLADICKEGGSVLSGLKALGGNTVIAKDVDSKRQLTEPLKSFIYVLEPAGRGRGRETEREGGQSAQLQKQLWSPAVSPHLCHPGPRWLWVSDCLASASSSIRKMPAAWWSSSLRLRASCTK